MSRNGAEGERKRDPGNLSVVEHRLIREYVLRQYQSGRMGREDICDANPELLRVANNLPHTTGAVCPVCDASTLNTVRFAFGKDLPAQGRAISSDGEIVEFHRSGLAFDIYHVEVCTSCRWNHLISKIVSTPPEG